MIDVVVPELIIDKWQNIVNILANLASVPVALIMHVDLPYIEVYRSSKTEGNPYEVGDKEHLIGSGLYCETVIKNNAKLLVPNALDDKDWDKNPDIKLNMISYLGFPLLWPNGEAFGTICILDSKENKYNIDIENLMLQFKEVIESHLELIILNKNCRRAFEQLIFYKDLFSHDIRNIIQVIHGTTELYTHYKSKIDELDLIDHAIKPIHKATNEAIRLISNVEKLSELEEAFLVSLKKVDLSKTLEEAIYSIRMGFQGKEIKTDIDYFMEGLKVEANELLIDVFQNILNNAVKYNKNEKIEINIKVTKEQLDHNNYIKVEFIDNGIGIKDELKEKIFRRGFKELKGEKGMGIGLSIVKKLMERYNGLIKVEDKIKGDYSKGSNFILLFPEISDF